MAWPPKGALKNHPELQDRVRLTEELHPEFCLYSIDEEHGVARSTAAARLKKVDNAAEKKGWEYAATGEDKVCLYDEGVRVFSATAPLPSTTCSRSLKPAWARTLAEEEDNKEAEVENLLDFADSLDIEEYITSMEAHQLKEAIAATEAQLAELEEEDSDGGVQNDDCKTEVSNATGTSKVSQWLQKIEECRKSQGEWDNRTCASEESEQTNISAESRIIAQEILGMNPALGKIHSKASLSKVVGTHKPKTAP